MKTLQSREKEEVSLQERKKHAAGKSKKLRKSIHDVHIPLFQCTILLMLTSLKIQDTRMKTEAQHTVRNNAEKIDKERTKLEELEASLDEEENALETIRDSLKGD
jgi:structural maintenance of chromosome 4